MAPNSLGPIVSRYITGRDKQFAGTIFQYNRPPLDSELNLSQFIELENKAEEVRSRVPSGWLMNESNPLSDYTTNQNYSNLFYFGRQYTNELRDLVWAVVNGWMVPVTGTRTGTPPLNPNDSVTWNRIELNPPSATTGGNKIEFAFLEVWLQRIDVDPAPPGIAPGKPQRGFVYRFGNVESGYSLLPDELIDPNINFETSKRVQIQYRIRVVQNINISQYPEGFDPTSVFAQGPLSAPSVISFQNMREQLGDPGLWRAGTGDPNTFGSVDGYVYAIPLCAVFRRNTAGFSDAANLAGAFNRNSLAVSRSNALIYTTNLVLPADLSDTDIQFTLTSISGTVLQQMNSFGEAYFKVDDEIIRINSINQTGPTTFIITVDRGQLQSTIRAHKQSAKLTLYTIRPDGLFADQISKTDILDLRHSVADKFDYDSILKTNLLSLLKGNLRTAWKRFGSTNTSGPVVLYGDRITDGSIFVGGLSRLDGPNGNRRIWSDAIVVNQLVVSLRHPNNSDIINNPLQVAVLPYNINAVWTNSDPSRAPGSRADAGLTKWFNGDIITITLTELQAGLPVADADQVRFITPTEDGDAVLIHFEGMTTDPNGGVPLTTSPSATNPVVVVTGNRILKHGNGINVTITPSGDLQIQLTGGIDGNPFVEFSDVINSLASPVQANVDKILMHIQFSVLYGAGRGLSHKPDYIHSVHYRGDPANTSKTMLRPGLSDQNRMIPTYLSHSPYVQTGNNRKLAVTSEVMVDPGSKTIMIQPYKNVTIPPLLTRDGTQLNWTPLLSYQGAMPTLSPDGLTTVHSTVDPLNLFFDGISSRYVEIPLEYLPRPGLHHIPITPITTTVFPSGINFLLISKEGPFVGDSSNWNRNLVAYPAATPGYYIVTPVIGETYGTGTSPSVFGRKYTNSKLKSANGETFKGIQFPPFYGPARITGIYLRDTSGAPPYPTQPAATPFNTNRQFIGGIGTDTNLMKDDFDGPVLLLDVDENGDVTFIVNADVIDLTKATPGSTWDNSEFIIECTLFGFDRGFLQTNGRILCARASGGSIEAAVNSFTNTTDNLIGLIVPAPLSLNATNNELTVFYSRQPYQGDVFGTQTVYSDDVQRLGPLTISEQNSILQNPPAPISELELPNKRGYEILAAINFTTSLGTGRISGSTIIPLLTPAQQPDQVEDYEGTLVDYNRRLTVNRVGFEDWSLTRFPVSDSAFVSRQPIAWHAISEYYDRDVNPEFAGCISQLPLGVYFRDKDFVGKTLYQLRSNSNIASIPIGTISFSPYQAPTNVTPPGQSSWEGTEFICGQASGTSGIGGESIVLVDGTATFSSSIRFKTARGGAAWSVSTPWPGGALASRLPKARPNSEVGSILVGTAYLVRSQPEMVNSIEVHSGNELQLVIVTQAVPSYFRDTDILHSASGTNEGFTAVDRFRIWGRPIEKRRGSVRTDILPSEPPLFVNNIYDDPMYFGSGDLSLVSDEHEVFTATAGQTIFVLPSQPLTPQSVQVWIRGVKCLYGVDYTISGVNNTTLTYLPTTPPNFNNPVLIAGDTVEVYYIRF